MDPRHSHTPFQDALFSFQFDPIKLSLAMDWGSKRFGDVNEPSTEEPCVAVEPKVSVGIVARLLVERGRTNRLSAGRRSRTDLKVL